MGHVEPDPRAAQREVTRFAESPVTARIARTLRFGLGMPPDARN
jgi:hypothetical protein